MSFVNCANSLLWMIRGGCWGSNSFATLPLYLGFLGLYMDSTWYSTSAEDVLNMFEPPRIVPSLEGPSIQYFLETTDRPYTEVLMANHGWVEFPLTNTENQTWFDVKFTMYFDDFHNKTTRKPPFIYRMFNDWSNKTSIYTGFSMAVFDEWLPDVGPCRRLPAIAELFVKNHGRIRLFLQFPIGL